VERRLAAILAADVVGYSRLIGADEAGTLAALSGLLKELVEPVLKRHRGRVVKLMGDGLLAEFASVVDAVAAAVEIQEAMPERSAHLADYRRIALRIGVNTGDIVVEGGDIFGDGVNIAARLQEIADPNGVAISEGSHRELRGRLDLPFVDAGEKVLKNIEEPIRTWIWSQNFTSSVAPEPDQSLPLSDKPSIAVLPFANMSGDSEQEYFADGMTEDIITSLSRFRSLFAIARNSTFAYKGKSPDVREVARELGVRYILEGSVRRGGDRIRITGQLIDAATGNHLWAERYDRELQDIFAVQDEITQTVVGQSSPNWPGRNGTAPL
jgi:adenylate cyclase